MSPLNIEDNEDVLPVLKILLTTSDPSLQTLHTCELAPSCTTLTAQPVDYQLLKPSRVVLTGFRMHVTKWLSPTCIFLRSSTLRCSTFYCDYTQQLCCQYTEHYFHRRQFEWNTRIVCFKEAALFQIICQFGLSVLRVRI